MSTSIQTSAKTVQEAINVALAELNTDLDRVNVEVVDEGNKGLFGLIGNKMAVVKVTVKQTSGDKAKKFLLDILNKMDVVVDLDIQEDDEIIAIKIKGEDIGVIIGRRGETLDSIQYLTGLVANRNKESGYKRVIIDVENYRQKREDTLIDLANKLAGRVIKYKKSITLEPMSSYERRVIHSVLQNNRYVETCSIGDEPSRRVVIKLKSS